MLDNNSKYQKAVVQLAVVLVAAYALKYFYSTASANDLRWILWPTAALTELVTGVQFSFESYAGYMSSDRSFLIAAACAGVNFMLAAFLMLSLSEIWTKRATGVRWRNMFLFAAAAFGATIVANTLRISSALWLNKLHNGFAGLGREEIHRLDGILIYFGCLVLLYVLSEMIRRRGKGFCLRDFLLPLVIYWGLALAVPFANGAFRQGHEFWQHAMFVFAAPIFLILAVAVVLFCVRRSHVMDGLPG